MGERSLCPYATETIAKENHCDTFYVIKPWKAGSYWTKKFGIWNGLSWPSDNRKLSSWTTHDLFVSELSNRVDFVTSWPRLDLCHGNGRAWDACVRQTKDVACHVWGGRKDGSRQIGLLGWACPPRNDTGGGLVCIGGNESETPSKWPHECEINDVSIASVSCSNHNKHDSCVVWSPEWVC